MAKGLVAGQKISSSPPPGQKITDYMSLMTLSQEEGQNIRELWGHWQGS